jgi:hypothetical protein
MLREAVVPMASINHPTAFAGHIRSETHAQEGEDQTDNPTAGLARKIIRGYRVGKREEKAPEAACRDGPGNGYCPRRGLVIPSSGTENQVWTECCRHVWAAAV